MTQTFDKFIYSKISHDFIYFFSGMDHNFLYKALNSIGYLSESYAPLRPNKHLPRYHLIMGSKFRFVDKSNAKKR